MKKMLLMVLMMVMTISAAALPFNVAQQEALFLSDKMAYELGLSGAQYEMIYEINLDYFLSINTYNDTYGVWWARRNSDIRYILSTYQYNRYISLSYFYRPLNWLNGSWYYPIYSRYTNRGYFYNRRPTIYISYKGGNNRLSNDHYAHRPGIQGGNHYNNHNNYSNNHNNNHNNHNYHGGGYTSTPPAIRSGNMNNSSSRGNNNNNHNYNNYNHNNTINRSQIGNNSNNAGHAIAHR